jgi:putative flippase GtrA
MPRKCLLFPLDIDITFYMKAITKQFSCFFIVGALSALIQFSILISFVEFFFIKPIFASMIGYIAGALINYILNHYLTFRSSLSHKQALIRFTLNSIFGLILNFLLMKILLIHYPYILSQILASGVILFWNFLVHRYWTFGSRRNLL